MARRIRRVRVAAAEADAEAILPADDGMAAELYESSFDEGQSVPDDRCTVRASRKASLSQAHGVAAVADDGLRCRSTR